jgi:hypothetical protein
MSSWLVRLVHKQYVGPLEHQPTEHHPALLAAGEQQLAERTARQRLDISPLVAARAHTATDPVDQIDVARELR